MLRGDRALDVYKADIGQASFLIAAADVTERLRAEAGACARRRRWRPWAILPAALAHGPNNLLQDHQAPISIHWPSPGLLITKTAERACRPPSQRWRRGSRAEAAQLLAFARRQALEGTRSVNPEGKLVSRR